MNITLDHQSRTVVKQMRELGRLTREGIEHASYLSGRSLTKATSKEILRKPKGGRTYVIRTATGRKRRHVASAPGETHANLTGALRRSLSFRVGANTLEFGYGVTKGDAPDYAAAVEFGSRRAEARPSLANGIRSEERNIENYLRGEIGKRTGARLL